MAITICILLGLRPGTWYLSPANLHRPLNCVECSNPYEHRKDTTTFFFRHQSNLFKIHYASPHPALTTVSLIPSMSLIRHGPYAVTRPQHPPFPTPTRCDGACGVMAYDVHKIQTTHPGCLVIGSALPRTCNRPRLCIGHFYSPHV